MVRVHIQYELHILSVKWSIHSSSTALSLCCSLSCWEARAQKNIVSSFWMLCYRPLGAKLFHAHRPMHKNALSANFVQSRGAVQLLASLEWLGLHVDITETEPCDRWLNDKSTVPADGIDSDWRRRRKMEADRRNKAFVTSGTTNPPPGDCTWIKYDTLVTRTHLQQQHKIQ